MNPSLRSLGVLLLLSTPACGTTFVNRGLQSQSRWLQSQVARDATSAADVPEGQEHNYESRFDVQVSPSDHRGQSHDPAERSELPDLRLYVRINSQRTEIGHAENAQELLTTYPLRLSRGQTIEVRLADRRNRYFRMQYDSATADDWSSENTQEAPVAQFSFVFEGPGRYFFHRGYGLFFIDFRRLQ